MTQDLFRHLRVHCKTMKEEERKIVPICYIHKVAMKKIEQEEPIPEYGIYRYIEYKCPVCLTTCVET